MFRGFDGFGGSNINFCWVSRGFGRSGFSEKAGFAGCFMVLSGFGRSGFNGKSTFAECFVVLDTFLFGMSLIF